MFPLMDIEKVLNSKRLCHAVIGISAAEFHALLPEFTRVVHDVAVVKKRRRSIGGGRIGRIKDAERKLFFILCYVKTYPTFDVAAFMFASSKSRTHEWAHGILPLLEKTLGRKIALPKRRINSPEEFLAAFPGVKEAMIDGVERPTIRSQKDKTQRKHYSGKKKRHMRKNIVIADKTKRILVLTPSKHGKVHDKKLADKALAVIRLPKEVALLADTGFVGIQHQHPNSLIPKKKPRGGVLREEDKAWNRLISSSRIVVEHAIGGMKRFRSVSDIYRNKKGWDDQLVNVAAGLWNLHIQLRAA